MYTEEKQKKLVELQQSIVHCDFYGIELPFHKCTECHIYQKGLCGAYDWFKKKDGKWHWYCRFLIEFWKDYKRWRRETGQYRDFFDSDSGR